MKTLAFAAFAIVAVAATPLAAQPAVDVSKIAAGTYKTDGAHTQVAFTVNHLGFTDYRGLVADAKGELVLDPKNPSAATVSIEIPLSNIATTSAGLTKHLHAADFFDSAKYPTATFRSTAAPGGAPIRSPRRAAIASWPGAPSRHRCARV